MWRLVFLLALRLARCEVIEPFVADNEVTRSVKNPEEFVDIRTGTNNIVELSRGNSLPLVGRPWGFNYWGPQTQDPNFVNPLNHEKWWRHWFNPVHRAFYGIRCTHQPSPWIGEYGVFILNAYAADSRGDINLGLVSHNATYKPYLFEGYLTGGNFGTREGLLQVSLTATSHASIVRWRRAEGPTTAPLGGDGVMLLYRPEDGCSLCPAPENGPSTNTTFLHGTGIRGWTRWNSQSAYLKDYNMYIEMEFEPKAEGMVNDPVDRGRKIIIFPPGTREVVVRIATSFISNEQAIENLKEVKGKSFEDVLAESKEAWRRQLSVVDVVDTGISPTKHPGLEAERLRIFYTALYRASLFPRSLAEYENGGKAVHYSPYSDEGGVKDGELSTDSGFWDAYHTVYPLLGLIYPKRHGATLDGWLNAYKEGGWIPQWSSPGYKDSMVSTMSDVVFADAVVKEMGGFDKEVAYAATKKNAIDEMNLPANHPLANKAVGRQHVKFYIENGYVPYGLRNHKNEYVHEEVSRTLNNAFADYMVGNMAEKLGKTEDAKMFKQRGMRYSILFDTKSKFFRTKDQNGSFVEPFDEFAWGGGGLGSYTEGGPWQWRFYAPHDVPGLAALYGGGKELCEAMESMFTIAPTVHTAGYESVTHEMAEMYSNDMGQYQHNNQPMHATLYQMIAAGGGNESLHEVCVERAQYWIRQVLNRLYTVDNYPGDEDNGEMAGWYVLSSLGLYTMAPGTPYYVAGSPQFRHARIYRDDSTTIDIKAPKNCPTCYAASSVSFNGKTLRDWQVVHRDLVKGGELLFDIDKVPVDDNDMIDAAWHVNLSFVGLAAVLFFWL